MKYQLCRPLDYNYWLTAIVDIDHILMGINNRPFLNYGQNLTKPILLITFAKTTTTMSKIYTAPDGKKYRVEISSECAGCAFENHIKCEKAPRCDSSSNTFIPGESIIFIEISQTYDQNIERLRLLKTLMPATEYMAFVETMMATAMTPDEDRKVNFIEEFINEKIQSYENKTY